MTALANLNAGGCTCRLTPVRSTDIDPPEMIVDRYCPVHGDGGPDPDEAYERKREEGR